MLTAKDRIDLSTPAFGGGGPDRTGDPRLMRRIGQGGSIGFPKDSALWLLHGDARMVRNPQPDAT